MKKQVEQVAKKVKITPTIAKILANNIVDRLKDLRKEETTKIVDKINKELKQSADYKKIVALATQMNKISTDIANKYEKYRNPTWKKGQFINTITIPSCVVTDYTVQSNITIPSPEIVKNDILIESTFGNASTAEEIVENYIKKYIIK